MKYKWHKKVYHADMLFKVNLLLPIFFIANLLFSQEPSLVFVDKILNENINKKIPIIGSLRSKRITNIMAAVSGKVDKVYVEDGDEVKKGDILINIDYNNYKYLLDIAKSNENKAVANLEISKIETLNNKLDLDRMAALKNSSSFNKSTYDRLRNLNDILLSKEKAAKSEVNITSNLKKIANLNLNKSMTRAPYNGVVEEKYIEIGEYVSTGSKLFQLVSKDYLEVIAEVPTFRTFDLSIGQTISFTTTDSLLFNGKIRAIGKKENLKTRTVKLFLDFDKNEISSIRNLIIDENVNILVPISSNKSALTIHKDAILKREGMSLAYIVIENKVEIRPLKLGEAVGNRFIVLKGVKENEVAVIKGNERLRPGQSVKIN